ncbi:MAG: PIN domain-containing protein [Treponema sp.]|nr:PIN domain-containing protein [Treponema sp.]
MKKVFLDTNVLLDAILVREPFAEDTRMLMRYCVSTLDGHIAAHSLTNIFYILHEGLNKPLEECRNNIIKLCTLFKVAAVQKDNILRAVSNLDFSDFEDALQFECAEEVLVDYIVTRNKQDFAETSIPLVTPKELVELLQNKKL